MVPNRECLIIQSAAARFEGQYEPPSPAELMAILESLPACEYWKEQGLTFQEDQRHRRHAPSRWTTQARGGKPHNRLLFVAEKKKERGRSKKCSSAPRKGGTAS
jgi:hypothetical protein